MEMIDSLLQLLMVVLPAGLVLLTVRWMQQQRREEKVLEARLDWQSRIAKEQAPLIFNAYERALLFLTRLEPEQLLGRLSPANQPAQPYARLIDQSIKEEYEHNLAQQLYILPATWEQVNKTQIAVRGMVMQSLQNLPEGSSGLDLQRSLWEVWTNQETPVTLSGILMLKRDAQSILLGANISSSGKE